MGQTKEQTGVFEMTYSVAQLLDVIEWQWLFPPFGIKGKYPDILDDEIKGPEATKLLNNAKTFLIENQSSFILTQRLAIFPAWADGNTILFETGDGKENVFPFLRQQEKSRDTHFCYADLFNTQKPNFQPAGNETISPISSANLFGMFSSTVKFVPKDDLDTDQDDFRDILIAILCGRLAEAGSIIMEDSFLKKSEAKGCVRPAPGYKALPDHSVKEIIIESLGGQDRCQITLIEGYMMDPPASTVGIVIFDGDAGYPPLHYIGRDQLEYYASKRGLSLVKLEKSLNVKIAE